MPSERIQRQIDTLLDEAEAAVRTSDWATVRNRAEAALAFDPENADARSFLDAAVRAGLGTPSTTTSRPTESPESPFRVPLPSSFAGGRYQVRSLLGEGAKKRVYLAHDQKLDRDVAFALIKTDGLDADGVVRVRREAQAMGRLGDNAHIVTIHDTGDENGAPFIVSQLMAGGSVEDLLAKADGHRIASDRAMKVAEQVCQALQHAHGRSVVHRDLKPGNVWLDNDGNAALGDFGLAIAVDRSRMTMQGMMVGTVAYMAPEQALGRTPDARSDLYALGAMLYEMVTGRPPFLGDDAVGVISQHINTAPVDPSWHEPTVPKPLETLILRLLAKSPDERPPDAALVSQELRRIMERSTVTPPPERQGADEITDLRRLDWGRFVGRREEMEELKDALEGALSGKGSLAMIVGEPGIGKTRLAEEFTVYAGLRGAQVLTGRCYEGEASLPYRPFMEALRQYVRSRTDDELRQQIGPGAPEVATLVSEVRQRFPDMQEAPKLEAEAERLRLFESVTAFLRNAAASSPLVLHLDDLHWADKPSLLLLQHIARHTGGDRLLLLGAYRDVELDRSHPLAEALGVLRRLPNYRRVLLRGMSPEIVRELLASIEPSEAAAAGREALAALLHQETEGNPLFIREVLAHLFETGKLVREEGRWVGRVASVSDLGIPEGVREVIGRRLSHLSAGCNQMLTLASTMTGGFTWEALVAISADTPESGLLDSLEEALAAQVIAERRDAAGTYDFTHALIRQTLYDELSTPRRVLLHRQIGAALEQLYAPNVEPHLAELAHHFYQAAPGGDVQKAIDYARRAADRAVSLYAWEEAAEHYERALQTIELGGAADERQRVELLTALGGAQLNLSAASARSTYERAALAAKTAGLREEQALAAAQFAVAVGRSDPFGDRAPAVVLLEDALEALPEGDSAAHALAMVRLADAQYFTAPREKVAGLARAAIEMARRLGESATLSAVLGAAHFALVSPETVDERLAIAHELFALASATGDKAAILEAHFYRRVDLAELGDIDATQRDIETSLTRAKELRDQGAISNTSFALVMRPLLEGRFEEAERQMQQALVLGQALGGEGPIILFGAQLAILRQLQGRLAEVEPLIRTQMEQYPNIVAYRCALAWIHGETDREEEARAEFDELAGHGFAALPRDGVWLISIYLITELCGYLGDVQRARVLYDLLLPYARLNITTGSPALATGSASRQLGMMASVMERYEEADRHFEYALAFDQKMRARPWIAHTQYNYAKMLIARDAPGDKAKALSMLQDALATAQDLGMAKIIERGLALKLQAQGAASSGIYTSIDAVARAVHDERPSLPQQALAPDGTVTIMFSDIEDSTVLTERLGDQAWQELLRKHNALIREQLRAHEGYEVKTMGDGFMVAFQSAKKGLDCAIAIQRAFDGHNAADGERVKVRIGLHAGEAIKEGDDFYGKNVVMASRVAGKAVGGEILVSSLLRQLVESSVSTDAFADSRDVELKGLGGTHTVHAVRWAGA